MPLLVTDWLILFEARTKLVVVRWSFSHIERDVGVDWPGFKPRKPMIVLDWTLKALGLFSKVGIPQRWWRVHPIWETWNHKGGLERGEPVSH